MRAIGPGPGKGNGRRNGKQRGGGREGWLKRRAVIEIVSIVFFWGGQRGKSHGAVFFSPSRAVSRDWSPFQGLWGAMEGTVWTTLRRHHTSVPPPLPESHVASFLPRQSAGFHGLYPGFPLRFSLVSRLFRNSCPDGAAI